MSRYEKNREKTAHAVALAPTPVHLDADPRVPAWLDAGCWLSSDVLLLLIQEDGAAAYPPQVALASGELSFSLETHALALGPAAGAARRQAILVRFPLPGSWHASSHLQLCTPGGKLTLLRSDLDAAACDFKTLLREHLAGLSVEERAEVLRFLGRGLAPGHNAETAFQLCRNLLQAREALRQRLPACLISCERPQAVHVDSLHAIDEKSFYVRGWARDQEGVISRLTLVSPEGARAELLGELYRYPRPDLDQFFGQTAAAPARARPGFLGYFTLDTPSYLADGWVVEVCNTAGTGCEAKVPAVDRDRAALRDGALADLAHERWPERELLLNHVCPAVDRLQELHRHGVAATGVTAFGPGPSDPDVSVVVPLYRRIDFLEQQLVQFAHDPAMRQADLLYVLDSPELAEPLLEIAGHLFLLYRVPFRVAVLDRNVGFSTVNNLGASLARGRLLLLLNSDVLPDRPGWLESMADFYDATPRIGALGPKLLFEDDSLQHAGMYFRRPAPEAPWGNEHFFKGMHRSLPAANQARPVPAVTGACLMVARGLYQEVGGLRGVYVQGDYEDSDLCLRLLEAGRENWYLPGVELYHLEAQSYQPGLRELTGRYNRRLHSHLWDGAMDAVMARFERAGCGRGAAAIASEPRMAERTCVS